MKFSIGEFSTITSLSIKSLRLYHDKGILIPAEVDEFTGYRYYDEGNFETARSIKILKEYDFTLAEIKDILAECNDESDMLEQLKTKLEQIQEKIDRYKDVTHLIDSIIIHEQESNMRSENEFEVEEKELNTLLIAGNRMKGKYSDVGKGFALLGKKMGRHINGKAMSLYYDGEYKEDYADIEPCFPVRKGKDVEGINIRELTGGKCVSLIHKGPFEKLSESIKKIFSYVNQKGYKTKLPTREVYLKGPGMIFKGNPQNYLTEIQILLEK